MSEPLVVGTQLEHFHKRVVGYVPIPEPFCLLALDPGETTGVAVFEGYALRKALQLNTSEMGLGLDRLENLFAEEKPTHVAIENYQVYAWRAQQHIGSNLHTPRVIGMIETLCHMRKIPYVKQTAQVAKGFATDSRLQEMGYWLPGLRHARDAIRHGLYYIVFPSKQAISRQRVADAAAGVKK